MDRNLVRAWILYGILGATGAVYAVGESPIPLAKATGESEWPMYNKTFSGQRYSPLDQIDKQSVKRLEEVCRAKVADGGPLHAGPVVAQGLVIVTAGADTVAIDARDCSRRWQHNHIAEGPEVLPMNRGVAYAEGVIYRGTPDGQLLAIDVTSGQLRWKARVGDSKLGETVVAAPLVWEGKVFTTIAVSDMGIRGRVMAFDAKDGRELWRFNTIPMGKERGAETWLRQRTAATGGGGVWSSYALDPKARELFVAVANPYPAFDPAFRPGANLYTNSLVVLDTESGKLKWHFQAVPSDFHDWDLSAPPVLFDHADGRKVVAIAGKDGYVQLIDRRTHKRLFKTSVVTRRNDTKPLTAEGLRFCPGMLGGLQWNSPALDPVRRNLYAGAVEWCTTIQAAPVKEVRGGEHAYAGRFEYDRGGPAGRVTALDADTGAVQWQVRTDAPIVGALLPTAGGVTFVGDTNGNLLAFDSDTGLELHRIATGGAIAGGLVTYRIDDRQYIATTSGNVSRFTFGAAGTPSIVVLALGAGRPVAGATAPATVSLGPADLVRGRAIFAANCATCHSGSGEGGIGPSLRGISQRKSPAQLVEWIKNPRPPMPRLYPSPLSEQDVRDVVGIVAGL